MYTVTSIVGVSKQPQSRWGELDIAALPVYQIYNAYREVYLSLTANFTPDTMYVDFNVFRVKYSGFTGTIDDLLDDVGNDAFDLVDEIPTANTKFVTFQDANRAGYHIDITGRLSTPDSGIPRQDKIDLRLVRNNPPTNMQDVYDYCMVNVNGFWHFTDTDSDYLYVHDAGRSNQKSRHNNIGLMSFKEIGKLQHVPITADMLVSQTGTEGPDTLKHSAFIKIPDDIDTNNKTVLLVLGGYLLFPNTSTFTNVGDNLYNVKVGNISLLEKYYESRKWLDFTSLGLDHSSNNESMVNVTQFYSDEVLTKYFTLSQSFFVVVDTKELFTNKLYIERTGFPGMFTSGFEPKYPLVVGRGKVGIYWKQFEDGVWAINVQDSFINYRLFTHLPDADKVNVGASEIATQDWHSHGYLLEIGSDFVE